MPLVCSSKYHSTRAVPSWQPSLPQVARFCFRRLPFGITSAPEMFSTMYESNVKESRRNKSNHGWHHHLMQDNRGTWWKDKKDIRNNQRIRFEAKQIQIWNREKRTKLFWSHHLRERIKSRSYQTPSYSRYGSTKRSSRAETIPGND